MVVLARNESGASRARNDASNRREPGKATMSTEDPLNSKRPPCERDKMRRVTLPAPEPCLKCGAFGAHFCDGGQEPVGWSGRMPRQAIDDAMKEPSWRYRR